MAPALADRTDRRNISTAKRDGASASDFAGQADCDLTDDACYESLALIKLSIGDGTRPQSWIQVAKTGEFISSRYGKFSITSQMLSQMVANFRDVLPKAPTKLPVDYDHLSMDPQHAGDGKAAGWFLELELRDDGQELWGLIEWTPDAAASIKNREYQFISPSFSRSYTSKDGQKIGTTLLAAAITNHPFLDGMAPVTLRADGDVALMIGAPTASSVHTNTEVGDLDMADTTKGDMNQGKDGVTKTSAGAKDSKVYTFKDKNGKTVEVDQDEVDYAMKAAKKKVVSMSDDPDREMVSLRADLTATRTRMDEQNAEILELRRGRDSDRKLRLLDQATARFDKLVSLGRATPAEKARALKLAQRDIDASNASTETDEIFDLFNDWCDDHRVVVVKLRAVHGGNPEAGGDEIGGDPDDQFMALADAKMKSDPKLSEADAIALAAKENPELYRRMNDVTTLTSHRAAASHE